MRSALVSAVLAFCASACAPGDSHSPAEPAPLPASEVAADEAPSSSEPVPTDAPPHTPPPTATPSSATPSSATPPPIPAAKPSRPTPALAITSVEATVVSAVRAEDGRGAQLETASAVAVDIRFDKLPGRALDPVLEIAGATFRRYETRPGGVLRYLIASRELAEAGEAVLRWGTDVIVVADKLRVR